MKINIPAALVKRISEYDQNAERYVLAAVAEKLSWDDGMKEIERISENFEL